MLRLLLLAFCALAIWSGSACADEQTETYLLSPGDSVLISVWREENLHLEVRVLPDGSITFPLAGRVEVAGLDSTTAAQNIAAKLEQYLPDPSVSVVITSTAGNLVYVLGKVAKPGPLVMAGPTSVLQALSMSGGLDKFADKGRLIDLIYKKNVRPKLIEPGFLIDPPVEVEPLAKRLESNPNNVQRMQILAMGSELGKGFSELNDPLDQYERFQNLYPSFALPHLPHLEGLAALEIFHIYPKDHLTHCRL